MGTGFAVWLGIFGGVALVAASSVLLFRAPYRLSFAYAGEDKVWKSNWRDSDRLPAAIRLTVRDTASERVLAISTVTPRPARKTSRWFQTRRCQLPIAYVTVVRP